MPNGHADWLPGTRLITSAQVASGTETAAQVFKDTNGATFAGPLLVLVFAVVVMAGVVKLGRGIV